MAKSGNERKAGSGGARAGTGGARAGAGRKASDYGPKQPTGVKLYKKQKEYLVLKYGSVQKAIDSIPWEQPKEEPLT